MRNIGIGRVTQLVALIVILLLGAIFLFEHFFGTGSIVDQIMRIVLVLFILVFAPVLFAEKRRYLEAKFRNTDDEKTTKRAQTLMRVGVALVVLGLIWEAIVLSFSSKEFAVTLIGALLSLGVMLGSSTAGLVLIFIWFFLRQKIVWSGIRRHP